MAPEIVYLTISHLSYTDERDSKNITDRVFEYLGPIILRKGKKTFIDRLNFMEQVRNIFFYETVKFQLLLVVFSVTPFQRDQNKK